MGARDVLLRSHPRHSRAVFGAIPVDKAVAQRKSLCKHTGFGARVGGVVNLAFVNLIFRTILLLLRARRDPLVGMHDVGRTAFRVLPTDLDVLGHMNNGVYLSIMDLGRMDLMIRAGAWSRLRQLGYYPVVSNQTISYRKSLQPWQRFVVETRIVGYDDRAVFVEQRFVVDGEIYARAFMRGRFLKKGAGPVAIAEVAAALGVDTAEVALPEWLSRWTADVVLPATRAEAPSIWV